VWAAALFARDPRPELLAVLTRDSALPVVERCVRAGMSPEGAVRLATRLGGRWSPSLSAAIIECFRKVAKSSDENANARLAWLVPQLTPHLDPSSVAALESWRGSFDDSMLDRQLRHLIQHLSTLDAITAAFQQGSKDR
jgi:hypothetical protein